MTTPVHDTDGQAVRSVQPMGYQSKVTITRPADTTAYTANDVVGAAVAALEFTIIGPAGRCIEIRNTELEVDVTAVPSGMTTFRLHLYNVTPPSAAADNDAFDIPAGDRASYLGFIELGQPVDMGSTLYIAQVAVDKMVKLVTSSLFAYLVTVGAFTPASATVKKVTLYSVGM